MAEKSFVPIYQRQKIEFEPKYPEVDMQPRPCTHEAYLQDRDVLKAYKREEYECCMRRKKPGYGVLMDMMYPGKARVL